jgi:site-specific recombinase XerD
MSLRWSRAHCEQCSNILYFGVWAEEPADIGTKIGNHTFRATGITAYLKNGVTLERAAIMANHASTRTTQLYDRRRDDVSLDEVERILI